MERSKKVLFISHCLLNQNTRPIGAEKSPGMIKDIIQLISESDVGVIQMPCPQVEFNGGLSRKLKDKSAYDTKTYRTACKNLAKQILEQIEKYLEKGYNVLGIIGVELSSSCAVYQITNGSKIVPGKGIFIEEIENEMKKKKFQVPIIGVNLNNIYSSLEKIQALLKYI
ncbi:MAG: 2-thiouracil desulfurase family protein [Candidatus Aenigmatarchaeota archaeon]